MMMASSMLRFRLSEACWSGTQTKKLLRFFVKITSCSTRFHINTVTLCVGGIKRQLSSGQRSSGLLDSTAVRILLGVVQQRL